MTLEFGRPTTTDQALIRIPNDWADGVFADGPMNAHNDGLKTLIREFAAMGTGELLGDIFIMFRMVDMTVDDMRILHRANSFYRDVENAFIADWEKIGSECDPWAIVLPHGVGGNRWWQIGTFQPDVRFGSYRLYYIETNEEFSVGRTKTRFDENSEFLVGFATEVEIASLKKELTGPTH